MKNETFINAFAARILALMNLFTRFAEDKLEPLVNPAGRADAGRWMELVAWIVGVAIAVLVITHHDAWLASFLSAPVVLFVFWLAE